MVAAEGPGGMSIDPRAFRDTVGQFVTGVTVIATEADGSIRAMTANSFASLSLEPPLVLFCLGKTAHLSAFIRSAGGFSVNILAQTQRDLSAYFAGSWKQPAPPAFSFVSWEGGPLLDGCAAAVGCAVDTIYEGGDHWIVIGRVLALHRDQQAGPPLVFRGGQYVALEQPTEVP
jgi:3-hydroxy-9,10-secoandrosta-1,3,5(10)-triene-9,17-dione monooxygenase reductase component